MLWGGAIAITGMLLQACVSPPKTPMLATDGTAKSVLTAPKADEKLYPVVLSISFNIGETYDSVLLSSMSEKPFLSSRDKTYELNLINADEASSTFVYSGKLAVGEYRLAQLSKWVVGNGTQYINIIEQNADQLGSFEVKEDTTTDLGRMVLTHANQSVFITRLAEYPNNKAVVNRVSEAYNKAIYPYPAIAGWNKPISKFEQGVSKMARAFPFGAHCVQEQKDGSILTASKMGGVFYFPPAKAEDKGSVIHADTTYELTCMSLKEQDDFDFLAYGEMNALYKHIKGDKLLTAIDTGNLPLGQIMYVVGNNRDGWFISLKKGRKATIYQSASLSSGQWSPVVSDIKLQGYGLFQLLLPALWMWEDANGFSYAETNGTITRYTYASKSWSKNKAPNNAKVSNFSVNPDNSVTLVTTGGFMAKQYISKDYGVSWKRVYNPMAGVLPLQYSSQGDIYATSFGFFELINKLSISEDQGKTWRKIEAWPNSQFTILPSGALVNSATPYNKYALIALSLDKGKTWKPLYGTFIPELDKAKKAKQASGK